MDFLGVIGRLFYLENSLAHSQPKRIRSSRGTRESNPPSSSASSSYLSYGPKAEITHVCSAPERRPKREQQKRKQQKLRHYLMANIYVCVYFICFKETKKIYFAYF